MDGCILQFRVHDVIRGLGIQIGEVEENFYCRPGLGLNALTLNECSGHTRILLNDNDISALPGSWRAPKVCALSMIRNDLTQIPRKVIGSMISFKVLDLSWTPLKSFPESVGCLKQLVCLRLCGVPMKRLPLSLTTFANLQILELTSLQRLDMSYDNKMMWKKGDKRKRWKIMASIANLSTLTQLKVLHVHNNGETISEGTLGSVVHTETLQLHLTTMTNLPSDIFNMSKLRRLTLECSHVVKIESKFCEFQNLIHLKLWQCHMLEELPDLHKLRTLKRLDIFECSKLKKFPKEFNESGAFPSLEIFSLVYLNELQELPLINEGAMSTLKIFTMMGDKQFRIFNVAQIFFCKYFGCHLVEG